jgi:hypothetical protein
VIPPQVPIRAAKGTVDQEPNVWARRFDLDDRDARIEAVGRRAAGYTMTTETSEATFSNGGPSNPNASELRGERSEGLARSQ